MLSCQHHLKIILLDYLDLIQRHAHMCSRLDLPVLKEYIFGIRKTMGLFLNTFVSRRRRQRRQQIEAKRKEAWEEIWNSYGGVHLLDTSIRIMVKFIEEDIFQFFFNEEKHEESMEYLMSGLWMDAFDEIERSLCRRRSSFKKLKRSSTT
jgi:hypothetical protein